MRCRMKQFIQRSNRMYCLTNIGVCLLCSTYLYTGYCDVNDDVQQGLSEASIVEKDSDPLSEKSKEIVLEKEENKELVIANKVVNNTTSKKTTTTKKIVTSSKKTQTSAKKYVKPVYDSVTGSAVVDYAKRYLGLRYVSGGNSLTKGTDCSGFTKLIYKQFGINLSRSVKAQVKNGVYVKKNDLQKGDLIFYGKRKGVVSHVAIYIGNGKVIHQSTPKSGVKINDMNMMVYITARRVISKPSTTSVANKPTTVKSESSNTVVSENNTTNNVNQNVNIESSANVNSDSVNSNTNNDTNNNVSTNNNQTTNSNVISDNLTYTNNEYGK